MPILRGVQLLRKLEFGLGFLRSAEPSQDTTQQVMNPRVFRVKLREPLQNYLSLIRLARSLQEHGHIFVRGQVVRVCCESLLDPLAGSVLLTGVERQVP